ncbi:hypothetical protein SAMN05421742_10521 [Roseospirillum parvum]|uniref:Anti-sigma factor NepR domain-containing protein n=1 Tax=Roseospirillum parvum TaxID=83401 RepID=A0A1G8AJY7_9PROT|nr:hypothetical protein SAMN05421742_10521 [Roseospirillum parvum]
MARPAKNQDSRRLGEAPERAAKGRSGPPTSEAAKAHRDPVSTGLRRIYGEVLAEPLPEPLHALARRLAGKRRDGEP